MRGQHLDRDLPMARYRRRRYGRRRHGSRYRPRRTYRRRRLGGKRRLTNLTSYRFARTNYLWTSLTSASSQFNGFSFKFNDIPSYSEFSVLFDSYQITGIKLTFQPNMKAANFAAGTLIPNIYFIVDYDDSGAHTSITEINQRQKVQIWPATTRKTVFVRNPQIAWTAQAQTGTAYVTPYKRIWCDFANVTTLHQGIKIDLDTVPATTWPHANFQVDVRLKMYFKCKTVR